MATLYAQSNHNWSARSGQWNTAANGSGSNVDPAAGDTLVCNNKTITVDADIGTSGGYIAAINNSGGTAGGGFSCPSGTFNVYVSAFSNSSTTPTLSHSGSGTLNMGTCTVTGGGSNNFNCIVNSSTGTIAFGTVSLLGGANSGPSALVNSGNGTITIVTMSGVTSTGGPYISNTSGGSVAITTATVVGGATSPGVINSGAGTVTIGTGAFTGGSAATAYAISNTGAGTVVVTNGTFIASTACNAVNCGTNSGAVNKLSGSFQHASNGVAPVTGLKWILDTAPTNAFYKASLNGSSTYVYFYQDGSALSQSGQADPANVRYGSPNYGPSGSLVPACHVPETSSVAAGVLVGSGGAVGTAVLTASNLLTALGMSLSNLDSQLYSIKSQTDKIPSSPAAVGSAMTLTSAYDAAKTAAPTTSQITSAISSAFSTQIGRIDAAISSRYSGTPPTSADIVSAIGTAFATEIGRIDAPISTAGDSAAIAAAVRVELEPELGRISNCATVDSTGAQIAAFGV